jgi:hypothetical protein
VRAQRKDKRGINLEGSAKEQNPTTTLWLYYACQKLTVTLNWSEK